jgi:PKD repeat protein
MKTSRLKFLIAVILGLSGVVMIFSACDELITETRQETLLGYPEANFVVSADTCCRPCNLVFSDNSDGPRHEYIWVFTNTTTLNVDSAFVRNPVQSFNDTGFYDVELIITDTLNGNVDNHIKQRFVHILDTIPKIPQFSFFTIVEDAANQFRFTFADSTRGTIKSWRWDFGDMTNPGATKSVVHTYADTGTYEIRLTIENSCDSVDLFDTLVVDSI